MESAASAGPRVYVPINHPDSPVPTYAVLQFLGFSQPPDPSHPSLLNPNFPPTMNSLPQRQKNLSSPPLAVNPVPCPSPKGISPADSSSYSSSDRDEKDKKFTSIKPSPMKKSGSSPASSLSPGPRRGSKGSVAPSISISHIHRDTIIHTHCSNFREVVHQLTGAGSGDRDLMPVAMPALAINRSCGDNQGNVKQENPSYPMSKTIITPKLADLGRPATNTKLLERRKSTKVLERLSTSCRDLPPLVPSPVTPLTSDFEKICLPVTPTTSQGSSTTAAAMAAAVLSSIEAKAIEVGSEEGKAMDMGYPMDKGYHLPHAMDMGSRFTQAMGMGSYSIHAEEVAITRNGFLLHSQRPRHGDTTLLHLFPESPREQ